MLGLVWFRKECAYLGFSEGDPFHPNLLIHSEKAKLVQHNLKPGNLYVPVVNISIRLT